MKKIGLFCLMAISAITSWAQNITVDATTPFDLSTAYAVDTLIIPLKSGDGKAVPVINVIGAIPSLVRWNGSGRPVMREAITLLPGNGPHQLLAYIRLNELQWMGTYVIDVAYHIGKDTSKIYCFSFSVNRPGAVAESTSRLTAGLAGYSPYGNEILLRESSGRAGVPHLKPSKLAFEKISGAGLINFNRAEYNLPAGGDVTLRYEVNQAKVDSLEIGVYSGKIYFTSPSLAAGSLAMDIEISNKRSTYWIFLIVFTGLFAGFGVRIWLKAQTESAGARLNALVLEQEIRKDSRNIQDGVFKATVDQVIKDLEKVFKNISGQIVPAVATQATAVTTARSDYEAARKDLDARYASANQNYESISEAVFDPGLSPVLSASLNEIRGELLLMKGHMDDMDVTSADKRYRNAAMAFSQFVTNYQLYMNSLAAFITAANFWTAVASPTTRGALNILGTTISTLSGQLDSKATTYDVTMTAIVTLQRRADGIKRSLDSNLAADYLAVNPTASANPVFQAALSAYTNAFASMAANLLSADNAAVYFPAVLLSNLNSAWTTAQAMLFRGAAPVPAIPLPPAPVAQQSIPPVNFLLRLPNSPLTLSEAITQNKRRFWLLNILQTLLLTLLIGLAAFKVYGNNWIGDCPEMIGVFFGAFTMDIAASSITNIKTKVL